MSALDPTAVLVVVYAGLLGLCVGSFLNVVVHRVPRGESVVAPPSACPRCRHRIRARHNVPVLGWLLLRGRCADCREPISARYPLVEAATGVAFALTALRFSVDLRLLPAYLVVVALGITLGLIDLDARRLPGVLVLPAYPVVALLLALDGDPVALLRAVLGAAGLAALAALTALVARTRAHAPAAGPTEPRGLAGLVGLVGAVTAYLSWGALLVTLALAAALAAAAAVRLLGRGAPPRHAQVPVSALLLMGAWVAVLGA